MTGSVGEFHGGADYVCTQSARSCGGQLGRDVLRWRRARPRVNRPAGSRTDPNIFCLPRRRRQDDVWCVDRGRRQHVLFVKHVIIRVLTVLSLLLKTTLWRNKCVLISARQLCLVLDIGPSFYTRVKYLLDHTSTPFALSYAANSSASCHVCFTSCRSCLMFCLADLVFCMRRTRESAIPRWQT